MPRARIGLQMVGQPMKASWHEYDEVHFDGILGSHPRVFYYNLLKVGEHISNLLIGCVTSFSDMSVWAAAAIPFPFQLNTAVLLIYSMSRLEAHQALSRTNIQQWQ